VRTAQRRQFLVRSIALTLLAGIRVEAQQRTYRMANLSGGATSVKTANAQGVKFPSSILLRADRVIE